MSNPKSTRTLILEEAEIISLLAILDFYKGKVMCYPNNHKLMEEVLLLEENIVFQSNREEIIEQMWSAYKAANTVFEDESVLRNEFDSWIDQNS